MSAQSEGTSSDVDDRVEVGRLELRRRVDQDPLVIEPETFDIVCECGHAGCSGRIVVTAGGYERVRRYPARFFIKAGHEVTETQRVVDQAPDYVVVERARDCGRLLSG